MRPRMRPTRFDWHDGGADPANFATWGALYEAAEQPLVLRLVAEPPGPP